MKLYFAILLFFLAHTFPGDGFYNLSFTRLDGTTVNFSSLQGKKLILFGFNAAQPDWNALQSIDSLRLLRPDSIVVIGFPALDFDTAVTVDTAYLGKVHDSLGLQLMLAEPGSVHRSAGQGQLSVFQWLTAMARNGHFNRDVEADGQLFIISSKGTLYGVIEKRCIKTVIKQVLSREPPGQ